MTDIHTYTSPTIETFIIKVENGFAASKNNDDAEKQKRREEYKAKIAEAERQKKEERLNRLGQPTNTIAIGRLDTIEIYESSRTIIFHDKEYPFDKINACTIDKIKKEGAWNIVAKEVPLNSYEALDFDKYLHRKMQNVAVKDPDVIRYLVTIQLFDLSKPTIIYDVSSIETAKKVKAIVDTIVHMNNQYHSAANPIDKGFVEQANEQE